MRHLGRLSRRVSTGAHLTRGKTRRDAADYEIVFDSNTRVNVIKNSFNQLGLSTDTDVNVTYNELDEDLEIYYSNNLTVSNNTRKRPAHLARDAQFS